MKAAFALWLVATLFVFGCDDDDDPIPTAEYRGIYRVYDLNVVGDKTDSVILTIENARNYIIEHFDDDVDFCNSAGLVDDFGSNFAYFEPDTVEHGNCDAIRIPRGEFTADFRSHGDTIWLDRITADSASIFRLLKQ